MRLHLICDEHPEFASGAVAALQVTLRWGSRVSRLVCCRYKGYYSTDFVALLLVAGLHFAFAEPAELPLVLLIAAAGELVRFSAFEPLWDRFHGQVRQTAISVDAAAEPVIAVSVSAPEVLVAVDD